MSCCEQFLDCDRLVAAAGTGPPMPGLGPGWRRGGRRRPVAVLEREPDAAVPLDGRRATRRWPSSRTRPGTA